MDQKCLFPGASLSSAKHSEGGTLLPLSTTITSTINQKTLSRMQRTSRIRREPKAVRKIYPKLLWRVPICQTLLEASVWQLNWRWLLNKNHTRSVTYNVLTARVSISFKESMSKTELLIFYDNSCSNFVIS